jgi:hypothetical protein
MIWARLGISACAALASSCAAYGNNELQRLVERPESFVGRTVRVCGWVTNGHEDHGIWTSEAAWARHDRAILGLIPSSSRDRYAERACMRGQVVRTGCGGELQCLDKAGDVPFALREEPSN